jgi:hopene-associated glycosyltransferase HpnB
MLPGLHHLPIAFAVLAWLSLAIWLVLFFAWGGFWRIWECDADRQAGPAPPAWPSVTAVIPARNEAESIPAAVAAIGAQDYPGSFSVVLVDDHSSDGTRELALRAAEGSPARITVVSAPPLPSGWTGKLWALSAGVASADDPAPEFFWFTDADILHAPDALRRLVARALAEHRDLASVMVLLASGTPAERALIPPFLYFFLMLYPPAWTASARASAAGAAGGSILLRRSALERMGGLAPIRAEIIDDCALARAVKRSGGRIWMGLTRSSRSLRSYRTFSEIRDMVARTAYSQLEHSPWRLLGTLAGMTVTFLVPAALAFSRSGPVWPPALLAWCLMAASFLPTVAFYRLSPLRAALLPLAALFYTFATVLSALRYWRGRGGQWKGRAQAQPGAG